MKALRWSLLLCWLSVSRSGFPQAVVDWSAEAELLDLNRSKWINSDAGNYSVVMDAGCLGCFWYYPARIVVRNREIAEILDPETGAPLQRKARGGEENRELVYPESKGRYHTIDAIFSLIEAAIANNSSTTHPGMKASDLQVEYDEQYGFPVSFSVGYHHGINEEGSRFTFSDGGLNLHLTDFTPTL